jgi:hypothetical protein
MNLDMYEMYDPALFLRCNRVHALIAHPMLQAV